MAKTTTPGSIADVRDDWKSAVNMTASELDRWSDTDDSKASGQSDGGETTGHRSGRRIVQILQTKKTDLTADDAVHMRKVVGTLLGIANNDPRAT